MMIDSVVWAQYINVSDTHTDSHVAIVNAAPTHCVGQAGTMRNTVYRQAAWALSVAFNTVHASREANTGEL